MGCRTYQAGSTTEMEYGHIMSALFVACIAFGSEAFKRGVQWGVFFFLFGGVDMLWRAQGTEDLGDWKLE